MRHAMVTAMLCAAAIGSVQGQDGPYHAGKQIAIGGEGGWDYGRRAGPSPLRQPRDTRVVIDPQANTVGGDTPDTPGVHGLAVAADLGIGFTTNGRENKASIVDLKTLKLIQKVDTGENPDAVLYEPARKELYTMNGRGKSATVIDAVNGKVVAAIPLEGKPEPAQADSKAGKVVHSVPVGAGVDSTWFDPATKLAFTSNGESGTVTIAHQESASALKVVQTLKTVKGARTMALDPATHTIYLAATDYEPQPAASKARPKPIAGTFKVLTYEMK